MTIRKKPPQARSQRAVREGRFEEALERFNKEQARKVALSLGRFHAEYVKPIEIQGAEVVATVDALEAFAKETTELCAAMVARLAYLELPIWERAWLRLRSTWNRTFRQASKDCDPRVTVSEIAVPIPATTEASGETS